MSHSTPDDLARTIAELFGDSVPPEPAPQQPVENSPQLVTLEVQVSVDDHMALRRLGDGNAVAAVREFIRAGLQGAQPAVDPIVARDAQIVQALNEGVARAKLAQQFGLSVARVGQIALAAKHAGKLREIPKETRLKALTVGPGLGDYDINRRVYEKHADHWPDLMIAERFHLSPQEVMVRWAKFPKQFEEYRRQYRSIFRKYPPEQLKKIDPMKFLPREAEDWCAARRAAGLPTD